jgi:hypothetical protein
MLAALSAIAGKRTARQQTELTLDNPCIAYKQTFLGTFGILMQLGKYDK